MSDIKDIWNADAGAEGLTMSSSWLIWKAACRRQTAVR